MTSRALDRSGRTLDGLAAIGAEVQVQLKRSTGGWVFGVAAVTATSGGAHGGPEGGCSSPPGWTVRGTQRSRAMSDSLTSSRRLPSSMRGSGIRTPDTSPARWATRLKRGARRLRPGCGCHGRSATRGPWPAARTAGEGPHSRPGRTARWPCGWRREGPLHARWRRAGHVRQRAGLDPSDPQQRLLDRLLPVGQHRLGPAREWGPSSVTPAPTSPAAAPRTPGTSTSRSVRTTTACRASTWRTTARGSAAGPSTRWLNSTRATRRTAASRCGRAVCSTTTVRAAVPGTRRQRRRCGPSQATGSTASRTGH